MYLTRTASWLLGAALLAQCTTSSKTQEEPQPDTEAVVGLATPIRLNRDTTAFFLVDYFDGPKPDSLIWPAGLTCDTTVSPWKITGTPANRVDVLTAWRNGLRTDIPVMASARQPLQITYAAPAGFSGTVQVMGSFNAWNRLDGEMTANNGTYERTFYVDPGTYEYKFVVNGREITDPQAADSVPNGTGAYNSVVRLSEPGAALMSMQSLYANNDTVGVAVAETQPVLVFWNNYLLSNTPWVQRQGNETRIVLPPFARNHTGRASLRLYTYNSDRVGADLMIPIRDGEVIRVARDTRRSDWETAMLYFMMVDRFYDGDTANNQPLNLPDVLPQADYNGGDLEGILQKFEEGYFTALGVNTIWFSPLTQNPTDAWGLWDKGGVRTRFAGYHGYWPISNVKLDARYGSEETLRQLLNRIHAKEMNALLDYVANHVHLNHPVYKEHPEWATDLYLPDGSLNTERWDDHRLTTWFDKHLPTLDLRKPEVVEPMTDSALVWLTEWDFDGFRHDATKHIDELYWRTLTRKVKQEVARPKNREVYQIGETYGSPDLIRSYISTGMLNSQFDFNLYDAAVQAFGTDEQGVKRLAEVLETSLKYYGSHHLMGNISGNQDRSRFISLAAGDLRFDEDQKLAGYTRKIGMPEDNAAYKRLLQLHAFNFAVPGVPVIYYGDEFGLPGANDPDNRRMMKFDGFNAQEQMVLDGVKQLAQARKNLTALQFGSTKVETLGNKVLLVTRNYLNHYVVAVFNTGSEPVFVPIDQTPIPEGRQVIGYRRSKPLTVVDGRSGFWIASNDFDYLLSKAP